MMQSTPETKRVAGSPRSGRGRDAYTLIELVVAMVSGTVLLVGLASALLVTSRVFDRSPVTANRNQAAEVQQDMLVDLQEARSFTTRTGTTATFTVPDRDGDLADETLTYSWSSGTNELTLSHNGGSPLVLLDGVTGFAFDWSSRVMTGDSGPAPLIDPLQWGTRWAVASANFGYETAFPLFTSDRRKAIATRVTLPEDGTLDSITAYLSFPLGGDSDVTFAIYGVDNNDNPKDLIASTSIVKLSSTGWHTLPTAPTPLAAGEYYLALSYRDSDCYHHFAALGGETHTENQDAVKNGWSSTFNSQNDNDQQIAIYGTYHVD